MDQFDIIPAIHTDRPQIVSLLEKEKLPKDDLPAVLENFFVVKDGNNIIGAIGLEKYEDLGLLRSMVVAPEYRNNRIASQLIQVLEEHAGTLGIEQIFLLTETAENYFSKKGYMETARVDVPLRIQTSSEFSTLCPISAKVMKKSI
mgnify:CR=1 FL=1